MVKETYLIHEAAKEVHVESHVLRYWEEELNLPIHRNQQGHRTYTREDIERLTHIKYLKDQGLQLKAVKAFLEQSETLGDREEGYGDMRADNPFAQKQLTKIYKNPDAKVIPMKVIETEKWKENKNMIEVKEKKLTEKEKREFAMKMKDNTEFIENKEEKVARMQFLLQKMIKNAIEDNNINLVRKISENIKSDVSKELDYQFRVWQEREDEREEERTQRQKEIEEKQLQRQEEHYKKLDELLRARSDKTIKQPRKDKEASRIFKFIQKGIEG